MKHAIILFPLFAGIILLFLSGCDQFQQDSDDEVLARVGNETLTLEEALNSLPEVVLEQDTLSALSNFQSAWIDKKIVEQEAIRIGLDRNTELNRKIERMRSQMIESAFKDLIINQNREELQVTREEAQNYYQAHKDRFVLDERYVRFRHITTRTRVEAENARRDLMRGDEWPDVAENYSVRPDLQVRESEQFWPISMAVSDIPIMNRYLNIIGTTEISPIEARGGYYHFVQLMESREEGDHPDLDWLIDQVQEWLRLEKTQRMVNSYIRNLYLQAEANNEIEQRNVEEIQHSFIENLLTSDQN